MTDTYGRGLVVTMFALPVGYLLFETLISAAIVAIGVGVFAAVFVKPAPESSPASAPER